METLHYSEKQMAANEYASVILLLIQVNHFLKNA